MTVMTPQSVRRMVNGGCGRNCDSRARGLAGVNVLVVPFGVEWPPILERTLSPAPPPAFDARRESIWLNHLPDWWGRRCKGARPPWLGRPPLNGSPTQRILQPCAARPPQLHVTDLGPAGIRSERAPRKASANGIPRLEVAGVGVALGKF